MPGNRYMDTKRLFTKDNIIQYRFNMVTYALKHNLSKAAIEFKTTRKLSENGLNHTKKTMKMD